MENAMNATDFDAAAFVQTHSNSYVVFITGGWNYTTNEAYYQCLLCYGYHRKRIERNFEILRSPNVAMLHGVIDACSLLKKENTDLLLITPTALGFKKGAKGKGVNASLVQEVLQICEKKKIKVQDLALQNGGQLIRDIVEEKVLV